jgi:hypothetical protein
MLHWQTAGRVRIANQNRLERCAAHIESEEEMAVFDANERLDARAERIGYQTDALLDRFSAHTLCNRIARTIPQEKASGRSRLFSNAFRAILLLTQSLLCMTLVSCDNNFYTGLDILKQAVLFDYNGFDQWGQAGLLICTGICAVMFARSFMKRPRFAFIVNASAAALFIMLVMLYYYGTSQRYEVLSGGFFMAAAYCVLFAAAVLARAAEVRSLRIAVLPNRLDPARAPLLQYRPLFFAHAVLLVILEFFLKSATGNNVRYLALWTLGVLVLAWFLTEVRSARARALTILLSAAECGMAFLCVAYLISYRKSFAVLLCAAAFVLMTLFSPWLLGRAGRRGKKRVRYIPAEAAAPTPQNIFCADCGAQNASDARFCTNCGKPLEFGVRCDATTKVVVTDTRSGYTE